MKASSLLAPVGLSFASCAYAWGSLGHITTAYIASRFVSNTTESFLRELLRDDSDRYLAGVATWADRIRYTKWGRFTSTFHFIDAKDSPPDECNVDLERDCKPTGCVVSSLANYTERMLDHELWAGERAVAAKFVVHFVGDIHQPLHVENVAKGGNGIHVRWLGHTYNLHHVWDSTIAERWIGGRRGNAYDQAKGWADELADEISTGKFEGLKALWLKDVDISDPSATALAWARESNQYVCTTVLPEGADAIEGQELSGEYYDKAGPVVEMQVARAGYRLAAWLDLIVDGYREASMSRGGGWDDQAPEEL